MSQNNCPQCGAPIGVGALECKYCGEAIKPMVQQATQQVYPQQGYQNPAYSQPGNQQQNIPQGGNQQQGFQQQGFQQQGYQQPGFQQQVYQQQGQRPPFQQAPYPAPVPPPPVPPAPIDPGINPSWPIKSKGVAAILAIFLGGFGIHKFYLGKVGMGILYLLFCWTYIPAILGFIEGIVYLASNDHNFQIKNRVRIR